MGYKINIGVGGKIFGRCELARVLKKSGLEGYRGYSLADWVCLAFYESHFDTALVDHEADGSTSNGIFQINSHIWCEDYKHAKPNICQMHCSDSLGAAVRVRCTELQTRLEGLLNSVLSRWLRKPLQEFYSSEGTGVYSSAPYTIFFVITDLLTSNINDDIVCAMRIAQGPRGLGSW
ncbi:SPACA3: Sperm acrosome membrane-associated protein 3 [Crotalus adamanteus]|uniref:Sperm acrosome membrane-associated protein 3 n=1 Tax=Crotalus adamanteus TaxID=8729 RepID=A0AAW1BZC8_CROAD